MRFLRTISINLFIYLFIYHSILYFYQTSEFIHFEKLTLDNIAAVVDNLKLLIYIFIYFYFDIIYIFILYIYLYICILISSIYLYIYLYICILINCSDCFDVKTQQHERNAKLSKVIDTSRWTKYVLQFTLNWVGNRSRWTRHVLQYAELGR